MVILKTPSLYYVPRQRQDRKDPVLNHCDHQQSLPTRSGTTVQQYIDNEHTKGSFWVTSSLIEADALVCRKLRGAHNLFTGYLNKSTKQQGSEIMKRSDNQNSLKVPVSTR